MNVYILEGSPRRTGNTAALLEPFCEELRFGGATVERIFLHDRDLRPCVACRRCQEDWTGFGCSRLDEMPEIFNGIRSADLVVIATPIYSWYCTPPVKTVLDRMMYGMNKFYGEKRGPSLWEGKALALLMTCGYEPEKGCDLFEEGMRRYCKHSGLRFLGSHTERHLGYQAGPFMDGEKEARTREFAKKILKSV